MNVLVMAYPGGIFRFNFLKKCQIFYKGLTLTNEKILFSIKFLNPTFDNNLWWPYLEKGAEEKILLFYGKKSNT